MKLFKNNQIKEQEKNKLHGGERDCRTKGTEGTMEWCGYGIGFRCDTKEVCDEVVKQEPST